MVTNDKEYMAEYMKKYNRSDKSREYRMSYYQKNKERIKAQQRNYYHEHKLDPRYSHYLDYRLNKQRIEYRKKNKYVCPYKPSVDIPSHLDYMGEIGKIDFNINYGCFTISF